MYKYVQQCLSQHSKIWMYFLRFNSSTGFFHQFSLNFCIQRFFTKNQNFRSQGKFQIAAIKIEGFFFAKPKDFSQKLKVSENRLFLKPQNRRKNACCSTRWFFGNLNLSSCFWHFLDEFCGGLVVHDEHECCEGDVKHVSRYHHLFRSEHRLHGIRIGQYCILCFCFSQMTTKPNTQRLYFQRGGPCFYL